MRSIQQLVYKNSNQITLNCKSVKQKYDFNKKDGKFKWILLKIKNMNLTFYIKTLVFYAQFFGGGLNCFQRYFVNSSIKIHIYKKKVVQ